MSKKLCKPFKRDLNFSGLDHIVIGSGVGGLTVATWLAKAGKKVAIFEKHYVPGGFTHSFKRKDGFQWDVGVHYVGNMAKDGSLRGFFDFLTDGKLAWESMGDIYDVANIDGTEYIFKAGKENFRKQFISYFPNEEKAIDKYLELIEKANKRGSAFFFEKVFERWLSNSVGWIFRKRYAKYTQKTTYEVLSEITKNERLIAVLCAQCGNYGLSPQESSFGVHAMVIGHFLEGGYYPVGGADQICEKTLEVFTANGGTIYINADVTKIVTKNKQVQGIQIGEKFISCKSVISNIGVNNTFNSLLSETDRNICNFNLKNVKPASAHICLYLGLNKSSDALNLPKHNFWYYKNQNIDEIFHEATLQNAPKNFAYISFPSAKDPNWDIANPNTSTIQAITIGKMEWFEAYKNTNWMKRSKTYLTLKKEFEEEMLKVLFKFFPQIEGTIIASEVSTPLSTANFTSYKSGEIYGLAHATERFKLPFLRPKTKLKGLYLTGQDITIVGVAGAMLSGLLCATTILKFGSWKIFKEIGRSKK
ncbi:phytoene desaturase family protein [Aequorivita viscosa]|uniref:All-trans-retinol 13,14-reductase n=1 Tax=Aequorivita viscosa TaxID=797419 RepID=A0A1M6J704_9FLAO|nr:NAD(P)/FAD-dependent oxidoreductase [Aequorivita viscosa]SDX06679.1 all-trans-retinol 13,14-reductase [Aequorivita viscosa]SHJ42449.1 all-trans-retinol 13,14-reductase [Aequorivita viscosa]